MARPTVLHQGFLIPNAGSVASPKMSEPDRVDFNTLGNARYGVIEGCLVTVSGSSATNTAGTAIVNGALVVMLGGQSANLGSSGSQDRYDLLAVDTNGKLKVLPGTAAQSPLFPDPPTDVTVLAAVYCPAGAGSYVDNVIDKRKFLPMSLLTKIDGAASLVANRNGTGDMFSIAGDGSTVWGNDTILKRWAPKSLTLSENLDIEGDLSVGRNIVGVGTINVSGRAVSSNLRRDMPASSQLGDICQSADGRIYVYQLSGWQEIATVESAIPVGSVITSLIAPAAMSHGWLALDGTVIQEAVYSTPFTIPALAPYIIAGGTAPTRSMKLPDARNRMLMASATAAVMEGSSSITVLLANMPPHQHGVTTTGPAGGLDLTARTSPAGRHGHVTKQNGGRHVHPVDDPGHRHNGMQNDINGMSGAVVALMWGGQNKIDAYFNDRSHTFSVDRYDWTMPAYTGITIGATGSEHMHETEAVDDHTHPIGIDHVDPHHHDVTENSVGNGTSIDYTPLHMTVYCYLRV